MQPQQPAPSSEQPPQDAQVASETPSEPVEQPSRGTSFLQRMWRSRNGRFATPEDDDQPKEGSESQPASQPLTLTQEELDRRVQAETDRREAKRNSEAKAAERRKLRDEDPWAYAEQDRQAEKQAETDTSVNSMFAQIGAHHDRYTLDPLVMQLPDAERQRIMALPGAGAGLDGRKLIVEEGLKALEKHWRAEGARDAEAKLRRNPAFRKQVFSEMRRGAPEPEFISGGAPSEADRTVSSILRSQLGLHNSAS